MIVVCSTCQARFKVADEKIGPRGAKVRCSKCQTVFIVHKDLGVDLDLEGAVPPPAPAADPFGSADPFQSEAPPQPPATAAADPFGSQDPFSEPSGGGFGVVDPFVASVSSPAPGLPTSAVTDLSDLLGNAQPSAPPPEPSGVFDSGFDFAAPADSAPPPAGDVGAAGSDLALDERTPPPGPTAAPMPGFGDFAGADPFGDLGDAAPAPAGQIDFDTYGGASEEAPAPPPPRARQPLAVAQEDAPAPRTEPPPEVAVENTGEAAPPAGAFRQPSRFRTIAVNAVSLVALLAVALGFLTLSRGLRPGSGGLFRPTAMLGAMGGETERFVTAQLRSGLYERPDAAPLVFVSGMAVSQAPAPVAAVRVKVELVRRGAVVARGEARAGAILTPEELGAARDGAALASAQERIASRAPPVVKPGDSVPFLVAIADFPSDVVGTSLRVELEPAEAAPAAPAPEPSPDPIPAAPAVTPEGTKRP